MADNDVTRIAGNIGAMNALNALTVINKQLSVHQSRLATGKRINSAADDPAGLTIATKMLARSEGLKVALGNIADAKNLLSVAESGLGRINDILVQMRNKAEAGASDTMGTSERKALVDQMQAYSKQIDDVVGQTKWTSGTAGSSLIDGTYLSTALTFQTGVDQGNTTTLNGLADMRASNGAGSLDIAQSVAAARSTANNSGAVVSSMAHAACNSNLTELSSGTYRVAVDYGADGTTAQVQLFALGSSSPLFIDSDNNFTTEPINTSVTVNLSGGNVSVDFGNGLIATVAQGVTGTASGTVDYSKSGGTYELKSSVGVITENSSAADFATYMNDISNKLDVVSRQLAQIGSMNGRLTFKEDQISESQINVEGAYNRIMNANMAEEQVNASKFLILQQTATAMLAQANAAPQFLLSLFR